MYILFNFCISFSNWANSFSHSSFLKNYWTWILLKICLSTQKVPNGIKLDTKTFQVVFVKDHSSSAAIFMARNTNAMNKMPWICPTDFTTEGLPNMYFIGIAIKTKMRRDKPSTKATARKKPMLELKYFFINFWNKVCSPMARIATELMIK